MDAEHSNPMSDESDAIARRIEAEADRIGGLVAVRSFEGRLLALVEDDEWIPGVRAALVQRGVPQGMLDVRSATDPLTPYPADRQTVDGLDSTSSDEATFELPPVMRVVVAAFGAAFVGLAVWLAGMIRDAGLVAALATAVAALLAVLLLVSAVRGKVMWWKWLWFILP